MKLQEDAVAAVVDLFVVNHRSSCDLLVVNTIDATTYSTASNKSCFHGAGRRVREPDGRDRAAIEPLLRPEQRAGASPSHQRMTRFAVSVIFRHNPRKA